MTEDARLAALMARYQAGEGAALEGLYRAVSGAMLGYLIRLAGGNRATAQDWLQEVFLRVHRVRHTYEPGRPVQPWLYAIARHVAIDEMRRRKRRKEVANPEDVLPYLAGEDPRQPPGQRDAGDVDGALAQLPASQRDALLMTKVSGLSVREAAAALGTSEGAVKVRVHRALKRVREVLGIAIAGEGAES